MLCFSVNFPVVAGGFALLVATGATQAVVTGGASAIAGGATGLLGNYHIEGSTQFK